MSAKEPQIPSVWARPQRTRRDSPALSREQIVAEAMTLLDTEGLDALSMRKLGTRLNAGATSMYTYVSTKDELIELCVDEVFGELEVPEEPYTSGWRESVTAIAVGLRAAILRHPWMAAVMGDVGLAYLGPNMMRMSNGLLGVLEDDGFDLDHGELVVTVVVAYVLGMTTAEAAWLTMLAKRGQDEQAWVAKLMPAVFEAAKPYPRLTKRYEQLRTSEVRTTREDTFTKGLDLILDSVVPG